MAIEQGDFGTVRLVNGVAMVIDQEGNVHEARPETIAPLLSLGYRLVNDEADKAAKAKALERLGTSDGYWPPKKPNGSFRATDAQAKVEVPEAFGMEADFGDAGASVRKMDQVMDHRPTQSPPEVRLGAMPVTNIQRKPPEVSLEVAPTRELHRKGPDGEAWISYGDSERAPEFESIAKMFSARRGQVK